VFKKFFDLYFSQIPLIKTQISQNINNWFRDICEICGIICAYLREAFKDFLNSPLPLPTSGKGDRGWRDRGRGKGE
jgi:hypothetical protein